MRVFQVRQRATGAILWTGSAQNEVAVLDAIGHEAGYYDFSDLPEQVRAGSLIAEIVDG
jgi:hypothetical protein